MPRLISIVASQISVHSVVCGSANINGSPPTISDNICCGSASRQMRSMSVNVQHMIYGRQFENAQNLEWIPPDKSVWFFSGINLFCPELSCICPLLVW